jgi:hypothetical protein
MEKIFTSYDKLHKIRINIIDKECWFNIECLNDTNCKTFLLLIKEVVNYINDNNIKIIKQYICLDDCKFFQKSIITEYGICQISEDIQRVATKFDSGELNINQNNIFIVSTQIEDFIEELINVLQIKRI